jgi:hypothetical protein
LAMPSATWVRGGAAARNRKRIEVGTEEWVLSKEAEAEKCELARREGGGKEAATS